ncbi:MAG: carboxypeptidase regulatory-like domain-containing protein [Terracidiphilus sp.]
MVQIESPPSGSLSGRLTDLHSAPLSGISVVLRNQLTGAELRTTTAKNGAFHFASLDVGDYSLEADEQHLGRGRLDGIVVSGGMESRVQAAMQFEPFPPALLADSSPIPQSIPPLPLPPVPQSALLQQPMQSTVLPPANAPPALSALSSNQAMLVPLQPARLASLAPVAPPTPQPAATFTASTPAPLAPVGTPNQPQPSALLLVRPSQHAAIESQSAQIEPALRLAIPHTLPLVPYVSLVSAVNTAASAAVRSSMLHNPARLGPIVAASQKPDPTAPAVTSTIAAAQLESLPVSGRRWQQFLADSPAATPSSETSNTSFSGASDQSAEMTVDGLSTRLAFGVAAGSNAGSQPSDPDSQSNHQSSAFGQAWSSGRGPGVSEAAIREVSATAGNAEADSMRSSGGRTNIQTQGGSDALHGQAFLFDRQNTWGARNPFTQWVQNLGTTAAPDFTAEPFTPPDHEMVWGLGMGGRIRRDRLFWFAAVDSYRRNDPGLSIVKNPIGTDQYGNCVGFFCAPSGPQIQLLCAQLGLTVQGSPGTQPSCPTTQATADYDELLEQLAGLLGPAPRSATQGLGFARIDWQIAERHRLTMEASGARWSAPGGGLTRVSETYGNHSFGSSQASEEWLLARWEAYLTPNLLAVTQASAGRDILTAHPETPSDFEQTFLAGNFSGQLPQIVVDSRYGFTIGNPSRFGQGSYPDEKLYHAQEMVDWVHGNLLAKAGFELDHNADATNLLRNQTGTYNYSKVANFISDALAFQKFGLADALDPTNPHNCGRTSAMLGSQPCYSYYSQTMGPTFWHLSTNDWAGFATAQWQANKIAVLSAGVRWELEQMPPPIAALANPELPQTEKLPSLGGNWGPRVSVAIGTGRNDWPVLRLGYGIYYGRTENATLETALTQTGSLRGDLNFFMRPSDDCQFCSGGAPPFPYVFAGQPASVVKPGAVEFAQNFKNPEVHQAVAAIEEPLPGRMQVTASALLSLGRRLPIAVDTNFDPRVNPGTITYAVNDPTGKGPIKSTQITVPFYASWPTTTGTTGRLNPDYQQITGIMSRANSTYEAAMVKIARESRRGLSLHAHYTYAHAMDWNPNESTLVSGSDVFDPADFHAEYGTSDLDVRHSAAIMAILDSPWKLGGLAGRVGNGWMLSGIGQFHSGLPYTMHTTGSIPEEFTVNGSAIAGLGPGMNGSGGDNRVYGVGRNTFRYPNTWKADLRLSKRFDLGEMRELEILAETFNLFNHQNVIELETTGYDIESGGASGTMPTLCYLTVSPATGDPACGWTTGTVTATPLPAFGQPLNINGTNFYRERQIQLGLRLRF